MIVNFYFLLFFKLKFLEINRSKTLNLYIYSCNSFLNNLLAFQYSQQTMEKDNINKNQLRLSERKIFPNLRKTSSAAKNFITLSKVQLDKNMVSIQQPIPKPTMRQIASSFSHKRIISGNTKQFVHTHLSKTYRNFYDPVIQKNKQKYDGFVKQKSSSITNLTSQTNQRMEKNQQLLQIEKPKISTKPTGLVRGYSVNSHPGYLNGINEDRICVITNLNKSAQRDNYISFFSIYDGNNGVTKAEYFRDHFHQILTRDKQFHRDIQKSLKRVVMTIQNQFANDCGEEKLSTTTFLMLIVVQNQVYIASMGENKMVSSYRLGQLITNNLIQKISKKKPQLKSKIYGNINGGTSRIPLDIKKLQIQNLDFIVLGSEGLFQNFDQKQIGTKVWKEIISKTSNNFHFALGETTNSIMNEVFQGMSTKNVSIILVAFNNMQKCFDVDQILQLPCATTQQVENKQEF